MINFDYDENGNLIAYEDGTPIGKVVTMGDDITKDEKEEH